MVWAKQISCQLLQSGFDHEWSVVRNTRGSQKVPGILWLPRFGAPWVRTAWIVLLLIFTCHFRSGSGATSGGQGQWFLNHDNAPSYTSVVVSSPNHRTLRSHSEWLLAVPYSENGPQGDTFRNLGGQQIERDGRITEASNRYLPPMLPTVAGSMERVCVCVCLSVCVHKGPTVKVIR
jgi:hypothetical protein